MVTVALIIGKPLSLYLVLLARLTSSCGIPETTDRPAGRGIEVCTVYGIFICTFHPGTLMQLPESPKLHSLNSDSLVALRSHSKGPSVNGQHSEMTILSSRTIPAWATALSSGRSQADASDQVVLSDCPAPRINRLGAGG